MKAFFAWLIVMMFFVTITKAQDGSTSSGVVFGAKAGGNYVYHIGSGTNDYIIRPVYGYHAGGFAKYHINEKISAKLEALFSTRGLNVGFQSSNLRSELFYVDIPLLAQYNITDKFSIDGGVLGSLFLYKRRSTTTDYNELRIEDPDQLKYYEKLQIGALVGATYNLSSLFEGLSVSARYNQSFTPVNELVRNSRGGRQLFYSMAQLSLEYSF